MNEWGKFPFGKPNSERPGRRAEKAHAVVIGVYPSAWHVHWTAPMHLPAGPRGGVKALAVDVEPTVFWDGVSDDFEARLAKWKGEVGFRDEEHGKISAVSPKTNGSSGKKVAMHYLAPLGLEVERVAFTDIYPVFMVKHSKARRREQGDAIHEEYNPIAQAMGFSRCSLPSRIPERELPLKAAERFGLRLLEELSAADPPLVITLGREVWSTLMHIEPLRARPPVGNFDGLKSSDDYGSLGDVLVSGRRVPWLPLVHPGLLGRPSEWEMLHATWAARSHPGPC